MKKWLISACVLLGSAVQADTDIKPMLDKLAAIEKDPIALQKTLEQGRERASLCVHCHGEDGNSKRTYIPNLASQNAEYLFLQFEHFANGRRSDYVMSKLAAGLSSDDRIAVALYFSHQTVRAREQPVASSAAGEKTYQSVCIVCHGREGVGSAQYPYIAGQPYEFLHKSLQRFHNNEPERRNSPMSGVIKNMTSKELQDVAAFIANMPARSPALVDAR